MRRCVRFPPVVEVVFFLLVVIGGRWSFATGTLVAYYPFDGNRPKIFLFGLHLFIYLFKSTKKEL